MASRKLEVARFVVYETCVYTAFKNMFNQLKKLVKSQNPSIGKQFWKKFKKENSNYLEEIAHLYCRTYSLKELEYMYDRLKTDIGKKEFKKSLKLAIYCNILATTFYNKTAHVIDDFITRQRS